MTPPRELARSGGVPRPSSSGSSGSSERLSGGQRTLASGSAARARSRSPPLTPSRGRHGGAVPDQNPFAPLAMLQEAGDRPGRGDALWFTLLDFLEEECGVLRDVAEHVVQVFFRQQSHHGGMWDTHRDVCTLGGLRMSVRRAIQRLAEDMRPPATRVGGGHT
jgi:hypothetical protein